MITYFKKFIIRLVILGSLAYLALGAFMIFNQRNFIYFPDNQDFDSCSGFADSEKINLSGTRMYYLETEGSETVLVYYHGNAGSTCDRAFVKDILKDKGLSLLFVEYAGYSGDDRSPSRELILQDAENANEFINRLGYKKIVLIGNSLGTAVASYHQTLQRPEKMILFAPFDKLSHVGKIHYPFLPVSLLLREEYDSVGWMKDYTGEIIIIHGFEDEIIPISLAERLYDLIPSKDKRFVTVNGATHNTLLGQSEVWETVNGLLNLKDY